jgi:hypothetical protein
MRHVRDRLFINSFLFKSNDIPLDPQLKFRGGKQLFGFWNSLEFHENLHKIPMEFFNY